MFYEDDDREDDINPVDYESQDIEDILDQLSFETVRLNIEDQIRGNLESNRDFLGMVMSKMGTIIASLTDTEVKRQVIDEFTTFCQDLSKMIINKYDLACSLITDDEIPSLLLQELYGFFVQNHYLYAKQFFCSYIQEHKEAIVDSLGLSLESGDITTAANKKKMGGDINVVIISNIDRVIEYVMYSASVDSLEFLYTIDDGDICIGALLDYFESDQLMGNFVTQYLEEVVDENCSDRALEIRNDIRVTIHMGNN